MRPYAVAIALVLSASCDPATDGPEAQVADYPATVGPEQDFSRNQAAELRSAYEPAFASWADRGELSRYVFLNPFEFWPQIVLTEGATRRDLAPGPTEAVAGFSVTVGAGSTTVADYVDDSPTDGAIVIHDGRIVFEDYPRMKPRDRHLWFSVSKTLVSTAVAILEDRGEIDAHAPIDTDLTELPSIG